MQTNSRHSDSGRPQKILLARRSDRCRELMQRLATAGLHADARAPICFEGSPDPESVRRAVQQVDDYAWVVFSSPEGVQRWLAAEGTQPRRIAAVCPATAAALEERGWSVERVGNSVGARGLVDVFPEAAAQDGQRILLVRPEEGRPELPFGLRQKNYRVDDVAFYRTTHSPDAEEIAADLIGGIYTGVLFASPSAVDALFGQTSDADALRTALASMHLVAIGETTAGALRRKSLAAIVANSPVTEDLYRALVLPSRLSGD